MREQSDQFTPVIISEERIFALSERSDKFTPVVRVLLTHPYIQVHAGTYAPISGDTTEVPYGINEFEPGTFKRPRHFEAQGLKACRRCQVRILPESEIFAISRLIGIKFYNSTIIVQKNLKKVLREIMVFFCQYPPWTRKHVLGRILRKSCSSAFFRTSDPIFDSRTITILPSTRKVWK
ncbi:unnamed protein product [Nesidiocoris tenuis]|uniref:Uncharacterized protein n=1 Tax=Nesidiocoris tenuis TaxID=355587 RepID=A0A6H5GDD1_9HEMI|nr:unnamed protein product [Nesidiocoris tenuis]